ncbi:mitochondrial import receptor subunit TOM70-like [Corythoichthys intestinalis]|uniref:mitochondrial import receptor subunit TOM70-like n=1 Tax=Corythoichthys intestinalis TaxID=161448 RepID=UPI0025A63798|nr:mitochondrial import receptor subunit TOM70-like [Corythoichthys intestinalis]
MAASKLVASQLGTGLPRWQLALLVGAPIVLGLGAVYKWTRSRTEGSKRVKKATTGKQGSCSDHANSEKQVQQEVSAAAASQVHGQPSKQEATTAAAVSQVDHQQPEQQACTLASASPVKQPERKAGSATSARSKEDPEGEESALTGEESGTSSSDGVWTAAQFKEDSKRVRKATTGEQGSCSDHANGEKQVQQEVSAAAASQDHGQPSKQEATTAPAVSQVDHQQPEQQACTLASASPVKQPERKAGSETLARSKEDPEGEESALSGEKSGTSSSDGVCTAAQFKSALDRAQAANNKGNKYFEAAKYENAIQCFTDAIALCPTEEKSDLSTFYQNRAAANEQQMKWTEVVQDCSQAVTLNPHYTEALFLRAKAHEKLDNKKECLEDVSAVCIMEDFQITESATLSSKVRKKLVKEKAKDEYKNRESMMPSPQIIKSYFDSFTDDIISQPLQKGEKKDEDKDNEGEASDVTATSGYLKAKQYMDEEDYDKIISECTKEVNSEGRYMAEALLLRATFYLLIGNATAAQTNLERVINMPEANVKLRANALIKRGTMYMELEQPSLSTQDFNTAAEIDARNPDVYHHRGQLNILLDEMDKAVRDFDKCILLRSDFAPAQAWKCFALYQQAYTWNTPSKTRVMDGFEDVIRRFPKCAEGYALYAQVLTSEQQFAKANEMYDKCIELEPDDATKYVLKGLLQVRWKKDLQLGMDLARKAIEIDNKCDFAYDVMSTIEVLRGNMNKANKILNKAPNFAKLETEFAHFYWLPDTANARRTAFRKYDF